ncbi:MAG: potassium/proton antiporter, partial [Clostridiales bacterium]|nr:potassium/proton antiporter [Clostridiales bacterium]
MAETLLLCAAVIAACVIFNKISGRLGIPTLLAFILLGMFFGSDGIVKIAFDDYAFAEKICSVALIFIMFYGGFGTNWNEAKPIAVKAVVLSSFGTVATAGLVGVFCWLVLGISVLESFLISSVISSTDAASVFSILRSKRLNLRDNTASLLEVESGSNDPFSYMLTVIVLALMNGEVSGGAFAYMLFAQIVYGAAFGALIAMLALILLKKLRLSSAGFDAIFIVAVAIVAYALPTLLGGNGYLSVYITGIILGNRKISNKQALVHFFDGATGLMQMLLFFLLGLLAFPSQ